MVPSRYRRGLSASPHTPLAPSVYTTARHRYGPPNWWALCPSPVPPPRCPPSAESPFALVRGYLARSSSQATSEGVTPPSRLLRAHAPDQIPLTSSSSPRRWVFAGCCQSLLGDGPSRRYLCESFLGCLDPYPVGSWRCTYPFLPSTTSAFPPSSPLKKSAGGEKLLASSYRAILDWNRESTDTRRHQ